VTFVTTSLGVKKLPASLGGVTDCILLPSHEVIESGIKGKLRTLIGRDRAHQIGYVRRASESTAEWLLVFRCRCNSRHGSVEAGLPHFAGVNDGKSRLLFERFRTPIPELRRIVKRVKNSRRVPLTEATFDANGDGSSISESRLSR